jgi:hypothetical protein
VTEDTSTAMSRSPWLIHQAFISGLRSDIRTAPPEAYSVSSSPRTVARRQTFTGGNISVFLWKPTRDKHPV